MEFENPPLKRLEGQWMKTTLMAFLNIHNVFNILRLYCAKLVPDSFNLQSCGHFVVDL
jgi:hypothetical protein